MKKQISLSILFISLITIVHAQEETMSLELEPILDNTIFSEGPDDVSNGAGDFLFSGTTDNGDIRRALLKFDLSSVPVGVTVDSAYFKLSVSKSIAGNQMTYIYPVLNSWGEGNSDAEGQEGKGTDALTGDATWTYRFLGEDTWSNPGGDIAVTASDSAIAANSGNVIFDSPGVLSDIQTWQADSASNFGWMVITNENSIPTAKRYFSREYGTSSSRPKLVLYYQDNSQSSSDREFDSPYKSWYNDGRFYINMDAASTTAKISIYSITGSLAKNIDIFLNEGVNSLDMEYLKKGVYLVRITSKAGPYTGKFIVR